MASSESAVLQFFPSSTSLSAKVHPLVIFNICDCYVRRPDQAERVIGTLLGSISPDGTVDIRNSYAVPHNESSDQISSNGRSRFVCGPIDLKFEGEIFNSLISNLNGGDRIWSSERTFHPLLELCRVLQSSRTFLPPYISQVRESFGVALDIDYHHNMLLSHQKVNPKEVIVGWYSTGLGVTGGSALIHEFYSREVQNPIHLTVDTTFRNGEATIKAFVSVSLSLGERQLAAQFQEIPLDLRMVEAERVGFDILKTTMVEKLPSDLEGMEASMERLLALIDDVYKYVDSVVEGQVVPDNDIGRFIADTVASIPKISPPAFDRLVNDSLQDHLLLLYLSSITRTQLSLAEKLNTAAQIP
ncbi:Eukaryotic translation initiation factor 3 subunit F [Vitis vinifera]|uniref:Eukaryotic translation initiation factor 3 subunit F n=1 Tax=Vitis vinifera TaxID=29760 RepID=A0A438FLM2_VITVI|nr:Eukaryotic translation initiation factor 3 subunit F [Vitis vinifera]